MLTSRDIWEALSSEQRQAAAIRMSPLPFNPPKWVNHPRLAFLRFCWAMGGDLQRLQVVRRRIRQQLKKDLRRQPFYLRYWRWLPLVSWLRQLDHHGQLRWENRPRPTSVGDLKDILGGDYLPGEGTRTRFRQKGVSRKLTIRPPDPNPDPQPTDFFAEADRQAPPMQVDPPSADMIPLPPAVDPEVLRKKPNPEPTPRIVREVRDAWSKMTDEERQMLQARHGLQPDAPDPTKQSSDFFDPQPKPAVADQRNEQRKERTLSDLSGGQPAIPQPPPPPKNLARTSGGHVIPPLAERETIIQPVVPDAKGRSDVTDKRPAVDWNAGEGLSYDTTKVDFDISDDRDEDSDSDKEGGV